MIVASFDGTRSAAVGGVYQYDTGQRLVMHGIPSPMELARQDDMLSGDLVTMQAQFSCRGDSQAQMRLAMWDEARKVWMADVPDEYLTRSRDVHVYVYLYYGADATGERAQTAYEATFCPIGRPAPSGIVTEDQLAQWADIKAEIEISMSKVNNAIEEANNAADYADTEGKRAEQEAEKASAAAQAAKDAKDNLTDAGGDIGSARCSSTSLPVGREATASLELTGEIGRLNIGSPIGNTGEKGAMGDTGPADIRVEFDTESKTLTITTMAAEGEE